MNISLLKLLFYLLLFYFTGTLHTISALELTQKESAFLDKHSTITLGSDSSWAPYVIKSEQGEISGYDADVLKLINQVSGANFVLTLADWKTVTELQEKRSIDGLSTAVANRKRAEHSLFSSPYLSLEKILFSRKDLSYSVNSLKDLRGKTFGVYHANIVARKTAESIEGVKIIEFESTNALIEGVTTGKVDFMLGNAAMFYQLNRTGNPFLKPVIFLHDEPLNLVFVIRNDFPEAISIINRSLQEIGEEKLLQLKKKWFSSSVTKDKAVDVIFSKQELAYLADKKQIIYCIDPDWMPLEKIENGKHIGMSADYLKLLQKHINIPFILKKTESWPQTLESAKSRQCDLISLAMPTKDRLKYLNFSDILLKTPVVLATKPHITFIDELTILNNKKIGIIEGYAFNEIIREQYPNITVVNVTSAEQGLQQVVNGELFGYIDALATVGYMFQTEFVGELKISGKFGEQWHMSIATRSDEPLLLTIINKLIKQLPKGTHQEILNRYIAINYDKGFDYKLFWKMAFILIIVSLLFLYRYLAISKYNRRIKRHLAVIDNHVLTSSSDAQGNITEVSSALCKLTGYRKEELIGQNHNIFRHPKTEASLYKSLWVTITQGKVWQGEMLNLNKDGSSYWASSKITPTYYRNGSLRGYTAILQDISDKKRLEKLTITDTLTQIPNRLFINNSFNSEFERSQRYNSHFSLILIDIDNFKQVNDNYGHNTGDNVLINISSILKQNIRQLDLLGRWGGEEFLIICPETNLLQAEIVAEKIREVIECFEFPMSLHITCSFGITESYSDDNKKTIFQRADTALYKAKNSGRNRVIIKK